MNGGPILCHWHESVVQAIESDLDGTDEAEQACADVAASLARSCMDCAP